MTGALVTGAGGFVGTHLCRALGARGRALRAVSSKSLPDVPSAGVGLLDASDAQLAAALAGVDSVYFLAGIAHQPEWVVPGAVHRGTPLQTLNVAAPERWLRAADRAGVRHFVWVSTIKVLGDRSERPLRESDPYRPGDAYAHSKVAAERALLALPRQRTALTIVRPPLVYGPGVRGNFLALLRWAARPLPLPLAGARAPRSLIAVGNLCDLLIRAAERSGSGAAATVLHAADPDDVSVAGLLTEVRRLLGRRPGLFALPPAVLRPAARLLGREAAHARLFEPLQVDASLARRVLDRCPPQSRAAALAETVAWLRTSR